MAPKQMRVDRQARAAAHNTLRKYHEIQTSILPLCEAYTDWESRSMGLGWYRMNGGLAHTALFFLMLSAQAIMILATRPLKRFFTLWDCKIS